MDSSRQDGEARGGNPLQDFLRSSRAALRAAAESTPSNGIPIVIGNESADLDSIASSILYAYLTPSRPRPIPFLSIPRADLSLRPELLHVLSELQLSPSDLLCADDKPSFSTLPPDSVEVHLVDHNKLTVGLPGNRVRGIIDHHDDEGLYTHAEPRVIEKAGSCSSLVIRQFLEKGQPEKLAAGEEEKSQISRLALAAVLIDTANMTQKVTAHDKAAVETLIACLPQGLDRMAFFDALFQAKSDLDSLSLRDVLRKDYKEWSEDGRKIGISSAVKGIRWLQGKGGFLDALRKWGEERELDVVGVMTTEGKGEDFKRELLLWALKQEGKDCVKRFVERTGPQGLELDPWENGELDEDNERMAWCQGNLAMSRKQVAPLLRDCLRYQSSKF